MNPYLRLQALLKAHGFNTEHVSDGADSDDEHLEMALSSPDGHQTYTLVLDWMGEQDEQTGIISLYLPFPNEPAEMEVIPEAMRLVLWLNRFALVGHYGFIEESGQIYYRYNLVTGDPIEPYADAITEALRIAAFFAVTNGPPIDQVLSGAANCEQILEQLAALGAEQDPGETLQ